jgi:hypothetical protein
MKMIINMARKPGNDDEYGAKSYDLFIDTVPWLIAGVIVADGL